MTREEFLTKRLAERSEELERLRQERDELFLTNGEIANTIGADNMRLRMALNDAIDFIDPNTDPWLHVTHTEMAKRLRAVVQQGSAVTGETK